MTAILPNSPPSSLSPHHTQSPSPNPNLSSLPPLNTSHSSRRSILQRPSSYAKNRISSYSTTSNPAQKPSRPPSHIFPAFQSSLPYAAVRDFAYPLVHPFHYGPPAEASAAASGRSTPASELQRRLSDPLNVSWESSNQQWPPLSLGEDGYVGTEQLPQMAYGGEHGPPYSEDEDLHSPVVVSSRQKKSKSVAPSHSNNSTGGQPQRSQRTSSGSERESGVSDGDRGYFTNGDGSTTYYVSEANETAGGPGGEYVTYPSDLTRQPMLYPHIYHSPRQHDTRFANALPDRTGTRPIESDSPYQEDSGLEPGFSNDDSRYSRDYQFTIASPDEEMHGKAVALFDFARENENELPLVEGQVILVSYRHGQGWLVAQDPKTGESGLVPEEYVRLLRHIEGGWGSLIGESGQNDQQGLPSPKLGTADVSAALIPDSADSGYGHSAQNSNGSNATTGMEKRPPIVSTFSTSSKDLNPYPHHLLGTQAGQLPPQVVHYGSQTPILTVMSPAGGTTSRKGSNEEVLRSKDGGKSEDDQLRPTR